MRRAPWLLIGALACAPEVLPSQHVIVRVESDPGVPLANARVSRDGKLLMQSGSKGVMPLDISARPGERVRLQVECPEGFRSPAEPLQLALRGEPQLELRVSCPPLRRKLVVAVRADNGPDLPLRFAGREIARTDASGAAHALLSVAPGETLRLTLDTSASAKLSPQNPQLVITVPERDELVVFDQPFKRARP